MPAPPPCRPTLVEASARANSACEKVWREAKARADFALRARRRWPRWCACSARPRRRWPRRCRMDPYDALMDGYQRGVDRRRRGAGLRRLRGLPGRGAAARRGDPGRAARAAAAARALPGAGAARPVPRLSARDRARLRAMRGSTNRCIPSAAARPTDVRITTFYDEAEVAKALLGVLHETGHALYERGLPEAFARQPVGEAAGMAAHESQSLIVEMQACRSDAFLGFLGGELRAAFGGDAAAYARGEPGGALAARGARLHPRGCRRDHLSGACHPALPAGARDDRRARSRSPTCPAAWNEGHARACSASRRPTTRRAACRTSTGTTAPSAISRPTRWAPWPRRS